MRGEPQRGFAVDILRMRSWIALSTAGLPGLARERRAQWSRNLRRCQALTVRGWTKTRASRQPVAAELEIERELVVGPLPGRGLVFDHDAVVAVAEHKVHRPDESLVDHLAGVGVVESGQERDLHALDGAAVHGLREVGMEHLDHLDPLVDELAQVAGLLLVSLEREVSLQLPLSGVPEGQGEHFPGRGLAGGLELAVERRRRAV
jgi:hypothetical protein